MTIRIREVAKEDLSVLHQFKQGLVSHERPFDETIPTESPVYYYDLDFLIEDPNTYFILCECDDVISGCCFVQLRDGNAWSMVPKIAYLGFMYVTPESRGKHISSLLIKEASSWAKSQDMSEMRLDVYSENLGALNVYKHMGFEPYMLKMRLPLA